MIRLLLALLSLAWAFLAPVTAQDYYSQYEVVDVLNYRFDIDLNDTTDIIRGSASVEVLFKSRVDQFFIDLASKTNQGLGMVIEELLEDGVKADYSHYNDRIQINPTHSEGGKKATFKIKYQGIPDDGLIISENKFGDRTFFGDNWPDRAHHWLPVVDHPLDKALLEFSVCAPGHYKVVSNGTKVKESIEGNRIFSQWKTTVPLPTKLMVIGVSPFSVQYQKSASGISVSTWVYPQNEKEGFKDYSKATQPLEFFESYIAPYPYSKLANVQSKTMFGGMENASCIFYNENSGSDKKKHEILLAHEIAHQWFGDAVSEKDWHHVWLSEGFATYLADIYMQETWGKEAFVASMLDEREQVLMYSRRRLAPIVDTTLNVSLRLLNVNCYEKASWVLHMLRRELGDSKFQQCVKSFYEEFKFGNALTSDFRMVVEEISGKDFTLFFHQWFHQPGHPVLSACWDYKDNEIKLTITQHQSQHIFEFPLDIVVKGELGGSVAETLLVYSPEQTFTIKSPQKPMKVILDPETWLLFEHR